MNELENINNELENIDSILVEKQNTSNTLVDIGDIILNGKTMYYSAILAGDTYPAFYIAIPDNVIPNDEFTFYLYLELVGEDILDENDDPTGEFEIPSLNLSMYIHFDTDEEKEYFPIWLDEPVIEHGYTKNLFAFQTIDGGKNWVANQCYSLEV